MPWSTRGCAMRSRRPVAVTGLGALVEEVAPDALAAGDEIVPTGGLAGQFARVFIENKLAVVGAAFIVFSTLFCFIGPLLYDTNQTSTQNALLFSTQNSHPSCPHLLGTDDAGFDLFGRIMSGGQVSLEIGFAAAAV